ncbi:MAG: uL15 family ribosomal protein [Candidatus Heimdallarchaeota archaeon]
MMSKRIRKKSRKQRGSRSMGYGRVSGGHRKSGQRGGKGRAGTYKHHTLLRIKEGFAQQKRGFLRHGATPREVRTANLYELDEKIDHLLATGKLSKEGDKVKVNAETLGIDKLLGTGRVTHPLQVTVRQITPKARTKIEAAGGVVFPLE